LFQRDKSVISRHIKNVFDEGELIMEGTVAKFATVQTEGKKTVNREIEFFNLDVIISVGYRVKSAVATRFRIWATQRLREYIVKGFVLDDERLKNPDVPFDYFDELTRRIQDIRTSERRFYQKITKLDGFLTLNERDILTHAGRISHDVAQSKAELEYDRYRALTADRPRTVDTDFEQATKALPKARPKALAAKKPSGEKKNW